MNHITVGINSTGLLAAWGASSAAFNRMHLAEGIDQIGVAERCQQVPSIELVSIREDGKAHIYGTILSSDVYRFRFHRILTCTYIDQMRRTRECKAQSRPRIVA